MRCKTAQVFSSLQLDGRLSQRRAAALEAHVAGCAPCRAARSAMAEAWEVLGVAPAPSAPDDWRAIAARVAPPQGLRGWLDNLWFAPPTRLATAGAMAACVVLGAAAGTWLSHGIQPSMPLEALAMGEAFGDVPGASWLSIEGSVRP